MNQDKARTNRVETASADATHSKTAITDGTEAASATVAQDTEPAGEAASAARDERAVAARPMQAGKRGGKDEAATVPNQVNPKTQKNKAQAHGGAASKAKSKAEAGDANTPSKLDRIIALLRAPSAATLPELQGATGWQVHSVRGAMAGALRKKGYSVASEKLEDGLRRYRITEAS